MQAGFILRNGRKLILFVVIAAIALGGSWLSNSPVEAVHAPKSRKTSLPNYDIRLDKHAMETIVSYRTNAGKMAYDVADIRDKMARGEDRLREKVPTLKVEYSHELKTPEVIAPDVKQGKAFLSRSASSDRTSSLKSFLLDNKELIGSDPASIQKLKVFSNYTNPDGKLSFVELNQEIHGIPVFRGEVKAGFTQAGEIIRVINNLAPDIDEASVSTDFGDPLTAVRGAARHIDNLGLAVADLAPDSKRSDDKKVAFGEGDFVPKAEKIYFPTEPGVVVPAWRVLIPGRSESYYVVVDATSGTMLWRKNLTEHQTQPVTYRVYANPNAMVNIADSPFPMTPGPSSPNGQQGMAIPRTLVTRIGNEPPYAFNNLGWITDGNNTLDGNNVQAGLDREAPNFGDLDANAIDPSSIPVGSPNRVFDFPINPAIPTNPADNSGDPPLPTGQNPQECLEEGTNAVPTNFQRAVTTQLFYISNVFHGEMYRLGFTEAARNFQHDNFGRGGLGGDRISAQAQDCSGINNANFSTPADGQRPQMQMYIWQSPNPDIDGSLDADVIIHELVHGLSNRLHGNSTGLTLDIARGMGEGWSDFYAHCLLSEPTDPIDGIYTIGGYDTYLYQTVGFNNYYYGIRRFPKAIMTAVGGPEGRPHNPLTFQDIDSTKIDIADGAFNPRFNGTADQVHAIGEVWSSALWEIRARMIQRLGWEVGNRRILQFVTDGMKLAPLGPTPISERDAIIAAIFASGTEADLADAWAGFAVRGIGAGASVDALGGISLGGTGTVRVTESFDLPNIAQSPTITVSDAPGDSDGYPEPGESVSIAVPLTNSTGRTATGVSAQIVGGASGDYGTLSGISSATRQIGYTIPTGTPCGSVISITINVQSSLGPATFTRSIFVGRPTATATSENFDAVTAPALPNGWTAVAVQDGINFENIGTSADSSPNVMYARNPTTVGGGTDLTAPPVSVTSATATLSFRNSYNTERDWDGGVLEISIAGGPYQDILDAGGTFLQNGYNRSLGGGRNNPIASRPGWTGNSNGYLTTIVQLPAAANGKVARLRWRFGADDNTAGSGPDPGWRIDSISMTGAGFVTNFACEASPAPVSISGRVLTSSGIALRNAVVTLTDGNLAQRRFTTGSFGLFSFDQIAVGQTYTVSVASKRFRYAPRILNITDSVTGLDLIGLE